MWLYAGGFSLILPDVQFGTVSQDWVTYIVLLYYMMIPIDCKIPCTCSKGSAMIRNRVENFRNHRNEFWNHKIYRNLKRNQLRNDKYFEIYDLSIIINHRMIHTILSDVSSYLLCTLHVYYGVPSVSKLKQILL